MDDRKPQPRLGTVLLQQHLALLAMLLVTAALGAAWIYTWQQASNESLRINAMIREAQQLYRDMYRQAREVIVAARTGDSLAQTPYWERAYEMDARFERLELTLRPAAELDALMGMREAYAMLQSQINVLLTASGHADPYSLVDAAVERWIGSEFADAYARLTAVLDERNAAVTLRLERWNHWAVWVFPLPLVASILVVLLAHRRLRSIFSSPMRRLSDGAAAIAQGRMEHRVPETGAAEMRLLAASINRMAADLSSEREQRLERERQASLERLAPMVAHNIRNPLASIRALAQASHPDDDAQEHEETRQAIIATVDRLERWTGALLDYLYPFTPRKQAVAVQAMIAELAAMAVPQTAARQVTLETRIAEDLLITADRELLEQALHGLLINAIEASPAQGRVRITAERDAQTITIHIDDQGPGIAFQPEVMQTIGPGPSTKTHSTGIGIPFALRVCQAHGGTLAFSRLPTAGTRASVSLPVTMTTGGDQ
ncbi:MAG: HAMP domain-containing histidine kinase [Gammaproteobacteria bacterium]|nr:HAMP domain-containing histidine kinase [Gammaproteobacteria bacterium]